MLILTFNKNNARKIFSRALDILQKGGIIAYPTESFYALGVLAADERAVKRLYELKNRTAEKPMPLIVGDLGVLRSVVKDIPDCARELMERYWPGPLTIVFEAANRVLPLLTGGTGKVAARIPGKGAALDLARFLELPVTATSANPSGKPPAETSGEVINYFGDKVQFIINAGKTPGGKPSTIVDITVIPPKLIREGSILL